LEEGVGDMEREGAMKTLGIQGATAGLAIVAIAMTPKEDKKKKKN
jgi:hypothetical protein